MRILGQRKIFDSLKQYLESLKIEDLLEMLHYKGLFFFLSFFSHLVYERSFVNWLHGNIQQQCSVQS